jgi:DnaJ-class molecular chaperone
VSADPWAEEVRRIDAETDLCPKCFGEGQIELRGRSDDLSPYWDTRPCRNCLGRGYVQKEPRR